MRSERLMLLRGSLTAWSERHVFLDKLDGFGITKADIRDLQAAEFWRAPDVDRMRRALNGCMSVAFQLSGIGVFMVTAEYLAAMIVSVVHPCNWMTASNLVSTGLDGVKIIQPSGDEMAEREMVSSERMHALCLLAATLEPYTTSAVEAETPRDGTRVTD